MRGKMWINVPSTVKTAAMTMKTVPVRCLIAVSVETAGIDPL
jgi:hypothetical protein